MTKKKKEILDNLELPTSEVEERKFKEFAQEESDKQAEFYYESRIIPANLLRSPLEDASIFFNILIEVLDPDYHYNNKFESFKEDDFSYGGMIMRFSKITTQAKQDNIIKKYNDRVYQIIKKVK